MTIRLTKGRNGKPPTLTCLRDDGSCTWQVSSDYFARHDLIHYAVETTLGFQQAFFGLLAQGRDLNSFGTRGGVKDVYTPEEAWAETLVGLLQWPAIGGGPVLSDCELSTMLVKSCAEQGIPSPAVPSELLALMCAQVKPLHDQWKQLPDGECLELGF